MLMPMPAAPVRVLPGEMPALNWATP